ncbi:unnamed protein product [Rotaria sp. Silwood2]|nr:unnamed protein product [Rotaria sp. Silwood2]CAF4151647.1 unnamed protein product [Rotaria sp. Silwood2]
MAENDNDQKLPAKATDDDIRKALDNEESQNENDPKTFVYLKSSSIISILIIVIISLICMLTTILLIKTVLYSRGFTRRLSIYFGFTSNHTINESTLTFWTPKSIYDEQPIETIAIIISNSSSPYSSPPSHSSTVLLSDTEKKAQIIFRNIILPSLFFISIPCGILAFYMRRYPNHYPAWGARPKRKTKKYITIELK